MTPKFEWPLSPHGGAVAPAAGATSASRAAPGSRAPSVLIAGDCMLDVYLEGAVHRISPEAPVPVLHLRQQSHRAGGAANVALNLSTLDCPCTVTGVVGDDSAGEQLAALLDRPGIHQHLIRSDEVNTTQKIRLVSQRQQLLRMDVEDPLPEACVQSFNALARDLAHRHRWVLVSDYGKGALRDVQALIGAWRHQPCRVLVDPKRPDLQAYRGAWLLKPNLSEMRAAVGHWTDEKDLCERVAGLQRSLEIDHILLTRGEAGMTLFSREGLSLHVPALAREVYDVSGAGDTVLAALTCFLVRGETLEDAVRAANRAAGLVVQKFGTASVTLEEMGMAA
ncbi:bifunctional heptose 7-phosphate kinase/heptose 1-phosphate adenyltransferase [Roseateles depolymerans]|nr:PfkB family carbohydrate kinase [Roseateles depolymerans]REG19492.1 rfaE bifunctional protein kinase chain/domain [Roseateles depolymerans]